MLIPPHPIVVGSQPRRLFSCQQQARAPDLSIPGLSTKG